MRVNTSIVRSGWDIHLAPIICPAAGYCEGEDFTDTLYNDQGELKCPHDVMAFNF